uniref:Uncharacterized protein ycf20 n=1 Tax=Rhodogorgon sp. TaxID=2485824 RepID=A0A3G3MI74_9FLOR|nr:hypothetical protein [Rhodogorgon sp.]
MEIQVQKIHKHLIHLVNYKISYLSIQLIYLLLGFFASTALSTIPTQTGDWGIIIAALITLLQEIVSKVIYQYYFQINYKHPNTLKKQINNIKIGILYGLFVDAFKLGS